MKYINDNYNKEPINTPIWACAYSINDDTRNHRLCCKPVQGEIYDKDYLLKFREYSKRTGKLKALGVRKTSRLYADTYEECVELYNGLIQRRINNLKSMIEEAEADKI